MHTLVSILSVTMTPIRDQKPSKTMCSLTGSRFIETCGRFCTKEGPKRGRVSPSTGQETPSSPCHGKTRRCDTTGCFTGARPSRRREGRTCREDACMHGRRKRYASWELSQGNPSSFPTTSDCLLDSDAAYVADDREVRYLDHGRQRVH